MWLGGASGTSEPLQGGQSQPRLQKQVLDEPEEPVPFLIRWYCWSPWLLTTCIHCDDPPSKGPTFSVRRQSVLHLAACSPSLSARSREARNRKKWSVVVGRLDDMRRWGLKDAEFSWDMRKKRKCMNMLDFTPHSRNMSYMWSSTEVHNWCSQT